MNIPNEWVEKANLVIPPEFGIGHPDRQYITEAILEAVLPDILEAVATRLEQEAEFDSITGTAVLHRAASIVRNFGAE